jgi:hypothetical protein
MTEQDSKDKYIKCSRCKCKYINDYYHLQNDFGHNRLGARFKTCKTCRETHKQYNHTYRENHQEDIKEYKESHKDEIKEYHKQYKKDNREYYNNLTKLSKIKRLEKPCESGFQRCTGCAYAKDLSNYGQYLNRCEEVMHYVQCIECRNTKTTWVLGKKSSINL